MPELPEVETVRRGLAARVAGRRVERVEVGRPRSVRRTSPEAVIDGLTGATILSANRRGKYLLLPLDTGDEVMVHLRMSGQLLVAPAGADRPKHTHVVAHLAADAASDDRDAGRDADRQPARPAEELWFVDPRTFGEFVVFDPTRVSTDMPDLAALGVDPIADGLTLPDLRRLLRTRQRQLKPLLLDQHAIAGIGNIYADEILHRARLRPDRTSNALSTAAERRLHESIHAVLSSAIESGGSTLNDAQYVDLFGEGGSYQDNHRVYGRTGQRCITCGRGIIRRTVTAQRGTHYCPVCQT